MIRDLLLPAIDGGVYAQAVGLVVVTAIALVLVRRHRDWVLFVTGVGIFTASLMGLRTLH